MVHRNIARRSFLRTVGIVGTGVTVGVGRAGASHTDEPTISFPDGEALVLPETKGPMEAAVRTGDAYMPDGGWVVISTDPAAANVIGRSVQRLPAGHFRRLFVAIRTLEPGTHTLYATLFSGDRSDAFPGDGPDPYDWTQDLAKITF